MVTNNNTVVKIHCDMYGNGKLAIVTSQPIQKSSFTITDGSKIVFQGQISQSNEVWFVIDNPKLWSPTSPNLYDIHLTIYYDDGFEEIEDKFGARTISADQNNILLNGKPFYVRGYIRGIKAHDHADTCQLGEEEFYRKNILQAKRYGFNFIRFHSTIPSETLFRVADELGM
ncbi:MAG: hypothetical protein IKA29_01660, partial [Clostridia bacterium]|nr:hypothetical protein [Clostridia bacterium]